MPRPMKDSGVEWIGEIPADWDVLNLGAVTETMRNGYVGPTKDLFVDDGIKYIQSLHIKDGRINFSRHEYYVSETWANIHPKIKKNDVLIVQTGDIGNVGLVTDEYDNCNCHALIIATPRTDLIFPNYLTYYLRSAVGRELLLFYKTGALLPHLNSGKIKFANICVPPLDEQQRIATFLDGECARIDSVIEKTRASIVEYKKLKQAIITRAVTKGMRPARPMKDSGVEWLGDIPADWEIIKLKYISRFMQTKYSKDDGQLNYIGLENVVGWSGAFIKTDSVYDLDQSLICEDGDILFGKLRPYLAKVYLNTSKQCCSGEFAVIRIDDSMCKRFFWYQLMSHGFIFTVDSSTYGTKMPRANAEYIKNISVVVPPLEEQKEIAAYLDGKTAAIDSLIEKKGRLVTELERLKKSLIFEYVTGKKEAPEKA